MKIYNLCLSYKKMIIDLTDSFGFNNKMKIRNSYQIKVFTKTQIYKNSKLR